MSDDDSFMRALLKHGFNHSKGKLKLEIPEPDWLADLMTSTLGNIMIGWYLSNIKYANALIFYASYAIQKDLKVIKGDEYLLKEESLDIYNIIVVILKIRGCDLQN